MGAAERREREKTAFREEVLEAAREIVLKEGFEALTMRKIADAIEYAPGTIYLYFKSRDDIAAELTQRGFEELVQAFAPATNVADPAKRLQRLGSLYLKFAMERPEVYRLIFMERYTAGLLDAKRATDAGQRVLQVLIEAFDELRAQGRLAVNASSSELADVFWSSIHGIASLKLTCESRYPETPSDRLLKTTQEILLRGILKA